jgi:8-oxo-dGTP diphosphatase
MSKEKLFHVGIKALIENQRGDVLLLYAPGWEKAKTKPHWDIPGGRIQEGGSAEETLKREVEEETGIKDVESLECFTSVIANHEIPFEDRILGLVLMVYKVKVPANSNFKRRAH